MPSVASTYRGGVDAHAPDDDAAGRRHRGLVLAGIVLVIGVPLTLATWLSERNVDQAASEMAEDLRISARLLDDIGALVSDQVRASGEGGDEDPLSEALGHGDALSGASFGAHQISAAYEVRWGLATRCVHLLVREDDVRTDITDSARCEPRSL